MDLFKADFTHHIACDGKRCLLITTVFEDWGNHTIGTGAHCFGNCRPGILAGVGWFHLGKARI